MEKIKNVISRLDSHNKTGVCYKIVWLIYIVLSIAIWVIRPYFLNIPVVNAFYTREGNAAYIYNALDYAWSNSNLLGRAFEKQQIIQFLPHYNTSCIFTYIAMSYGKLVSIASGVMITVFIIVGIVLCRRNKTDITYINKTNKIMGKIIAKNTIAVILLQILMIIVVMMLQNLGIMPFVYWM